MNRFMAFGVAALFALAINVGDLNAQCCGTSGVGYSAPMTYSNYNSGCCNTGYAAPVSNGCCNSSYSQPRQGLIVRMRARHASNYCCTQPTNCCAQTSYAAPVASYGGCNTGCNSGCNTGCGNAMYTSTVSGCCNGCGNTNYGYGQQVMTNGCNGCGGQPVMMDGTMQGTVIEGGVVPGPEANGNVVTPPTPDDT